MVIHRLYVVKQRYRTRRCETVEAEVNGTRRRAPVSVLLPSTPTRSVTERRAALDLGLVPPPAWCPSPSAAWPLSFILDHLERHLETWCQNVSRIVLRMDVQFLASRGSHHPGVQSHHGRAQLCPPPRGCGLYQSKEGEYVRSILPVYRDIPAYPHAIRPSRNAAPAKRR